MSIESEKLHRQAISEVQMAIKLLTGDGPTFARVREHLLDALECWKSIAQQFVYPSSSVGEDAKDLRSYSKSAESAPKVTSQGQEYLNLASAVWPILRGLRHCAQNREELAAINERMISLITVAEQNRSKLGAEELVTGIELAWALTNGSAVVSPRIKVIEVPPTRDLPSQLENVLEVRLGDWSTELQIVLCAGYKETQYLGNKTVNRLGYRFETNPCKNAMPRSSVVQRQDGRLGLCLQSHSTTVSIIAGTVDTVEAADAGSTIVDYLIEAMREKIICSPIIAKEQMEYVRANAEQKLTLVGRTADKDVIEVTICEGMIYGGRVFVVDGDDNLTRFERMAHKSAESILKSRGVVEMMPTKIWTRYS